LVSLVCLTVALASAAATTTLRLDGEPVQGGLVLGWTQPGASVTHDGAAVRVGPDGVFLLGFGRDAAPASMLEIRFPDGSRQQRELQVRQREYQVQRIEGLPPKKVSPPAEVMQRIARERAQVRTARTRDDQRADFLAGFVLPAQGKISGVYGSQRILNGEPRAPHSGLDLAGPEGAPVVAPAPAEVSLVAADMYFSGGTVILDHGHGLSTTYIHLSKVEVEQGQRVAQGQKIGEIGATGRATGPHLHWGANLFQTRLDPQLLLDSWPAGAQFETAGAGQPAKQE
jgi:murein DD-endopeptidase MepM/ murein hydrolase activator NlpD